MAKHISANRIPHSAKRPQMRMNFAELPRDVRYIAEQLSQVLDFVEDDVDGIPLYASVSQPGKLRVSRQGRGLVIDHPSLVGFARGLTHVR
ncbi:MAG: hypothetical protein GX588_03430, partial [Clostridiaceae bacterium]|nr:hypothetical protein [Clostridiaceae bacterium]